MYNTIEEIKKANFEAGEAFFSEEAMKHFDTKMMKHFDIKIESEVIKGQFFITSEPDAMGRDGRRFTIRWAKKDGKIQNAGGYQRFKTVEEARNHLEEVKL